MNEQRKKFLGRLKEQIPDQGSPGFAEGLLLRQEDRSQTYRGQPQLDKNDNGKQER